MGMEETFIRFFFHYAANTSNETEEGRDPLLTGRTAARTPTVCPSLLHQSAQVCGAVWQWFAAAGCASSMGKLAGVV